MPRTRVLFLIPSLAACGAEAQLVTLVNGLDPDRFAKTLVTFEPESDLLPRVRQPEVTVIRLERRRWLDRGLARSIAEVIDQKAVDVVHTTLQIALLHGWLASRRSRRRPRLVNTIHTTRNRDLKGEVSQRLLWGPLQRACSRVVFVSERQAEHWLSRYPGLKERSRVIRNGVDPQHFAPESWRQAGRSLRSRLGISREALVVGCLAAFRPEKGHQLLLKAFAGLPEDAVLLLAGSGQCLPEVQAAASRLGLGARAHFLGRIEEVRPVLAACDLTVLASTAVETFSMAMLESLSMAVPVVATDIGGAAEAVLPGRTGALVPAGDAAALRQALLALGTDRQRVRHMGAAGRQLVLERFTHARMIQAFATVLKRHQDGSPWLPLAGHTLPPAR
ncbi:MAG: glycosyltransferase [Thermodesulfobacteriota bacterium]